MIVPDPKLTLQAGWTQTSGRCPASTSSATLLARRGAILCRTAWSLMNTHCHWVTPSTRVVVSSDAMTRAQSIFWLKSRVTTQPLSANHVSNYAVAS